MVYRRYRRSLFDELDEMRAYMDDMFQQMSDMNRWALLPAGQTETMLPSTRGEFRVDVLEHGDEVTVTADIIPGVEKKDIRLDLLNPSALEISFERKNVREEKKEGYYVSERSFGTMRRIVPLPTDVTEEGARASFKNNVLEVHLKKTVIEPMKGISIE
jgi:HSP20 family protein